jgi:hypothetical protein
MKALSDSGKEVKLLEIICVETGKKPEN